MHNITRGTKEYGLLGVKVPHKLDNNAIFTPIQHRKRQHNPLYSYQSLRALGHELGTDDSSASDSIGKTPGQQGQGKCNSPFVGNFPKYQ